MIQSAIIAISADIEKPITCSEASGLYDLLQNLDTCITSEMVGDLFIIVDPSDWKQPKEDEEEKTDLECKRVIQSHPNTMRTYRWLSLAALACPLPG